MRFRTAPSSETVVEHPNIDDLQCTDSFELNKSVGAIPVVTANSLSKIAGESLVDRFRFLTKPFGVV